MASSRLLPDTNRRCRAAQFFVSQTCLPSLAVSQIPCFPLNGTKRQTKSIQSQRDGCTLLEVLVFSDGYGYCKDILQQAKQVEVTSSQFGFGVVSVVKGLKNDNL